MVVTKATLVEKLLQSKVGFHKHDAVRFVELFFEEICEALEKGEEVKLTGFGNFKVLDKKERPGRNPKTGEMVIIKARRVVTFHAGHKLKTSIEQKSPPE